MFFELFADTGAKERGPELGPFLTKSGRMIPSLRPRCEDRVLDGPASEEKGSKGRKWLDCIRGKGVLLSVDRDTNSLLLASVTGVSRS